MGCGTRHLLGGHRDQERDIRDRVAQLGHLEQQSPAGLGLVARSNEKVLGWAVLSLVSRRPVYSGVAEVSVYVAADARGMGVGKALLGSLINASEKAGIWSLQAGLFKENSASITLHKGVGFREIGFQERKGSMDGVWRDVLLMERRSQVVGG